MTYNFDVVVFLTYRDKDVKISIDLTDQQVKRIKKLVAEYEPSDEDTPVSKTSLLTILEEDAPNLFNKFWKIIMPQVFLELLINGMKNYGNDMRHDDDTVDNPENYRKIPFKTLYKMYGDDIEIEHSCCCLCKIPSDMMPPNKPLSKGMSKVDIIRYIRTRNSVRRDIYYEIQEYVDSDFYYEDLYKLIDKRLTELVERAIEQNDEATLAKDGFDPFERVNKFELAKEIYDDFNRESKNK